MTTGRSGLSRARFSRGLGLEAYELCGKACGFPDHFHGHYVIGFVAKGSRMLRCVGGGALRAGDIMLLSPGESHGCSPVGVEVLDYRALNVSRSVMDEAARRAGLGRAPRFSVNAVRCAMTAEIFEELHLAVMEDAPHRRQERAFRAMTDMLFARFAAKPDGEGGHEISEQVRALCRYIDAHCAEGLSLDVMLAVTKLSKFSLIRAFAKETGLTPYRYLQAARIERAKALLQSGLAPADAADAAGFSDQSHLTNCFRDFTGLTPGQYRKIFME